MEKLLILNPTRTLAIAGEPSDTAHVLLKSGDWYFDESTAEWFTNLSREVTILWSHEKDDVIEAIEAITGTELGALSVKTYSGAVTAVRRLMAEHDLKSALWLSVDHTAEGYALQDEFRELLVMAPSGERKLLLRDQLNIHVALDVAP